MPNYLCDFFFKNVCILKTFFFLHNFLLQAIKKKIEVERGEQVIFV